MKKERFNLNSFLQTKSDFVAIDKKVAYYAKKGYICNVNQNPDLSYQFTFILIQKN